MVKSWIIDGLVFEEDIVYGLGTPQSNKVFESSDTDKVYTVADVKFELSNNSIIQSQNTEYISSDESIQDANRQIFLGTFGYDQNGLFNSGKISSKSAWDWEKTTYQQTGLVKESEDMYGYLSNNAISIENAGTEIGWFTAQSLIGNPGGSIEHLVANVKTTNGVYSEISTHKMEDFNQYRVSTYYEDNWYLNPISKSIINNPTIGADLTWNFGSSRYHLFKTSKTWSEAQTAAESLGGKLVEVETKAENDQLFSKVSGQITTAEFANTSGSDGGGAAYIWLGGSDGDTTSTQTSSEWNWKWSNSNVEISKSREEWGTGWGGTEPDDSQGFQHRLALGLEDWSRSNPGKYGSAGQWNDVSADNKLFYVVEVPTTNKSYAFKSSDYTFYDLGDDRYGIKTATGIDELTGVSSLSFADKDLSVLDDLKGTFDQVTGKDDVTGKTFRLYNAAFARFPDASGLEYWIRQRSSGANSERVVAQSFLGSAEFIELYGEDVSHANYVNNLYKNVLGREADTAGLNYWVGNLTNGIEERHEALLGFSESAENKGLFSEMTGLY
uniref:DUF4214 domain-containing protein n=1 Tax=Prochlorococcus marinus TaxID=1219 RepID=UPI00030058D9|nr:DUF4214 domain-containing protein [Prochlorococcus marinus]